jgi:PucR C-terminal helix-turn-helix domain
MTKNLDPQPWRGLPVKVADVIEPELPAIAEDIVATIAREVPEYARPLKGRFGRGIKTGVGEALTQFVALIRDPEAGREPGREVYVELGRGELRVGRTLDSLQAAYRIGARVAWRRVAAAGHRAKLDPESLTLLAEAIFAYIDGISADSVDGYAEAQSADQDLRRRRRQELVSLLLSDPPALAADVAVAARAADWRLPASVAAAACLDRDLPAIVARVAPDVLVTAREGVGCLLVPDPEGPRLEELKRASSKGALAVGPPSGPLEVAGSWALASTLLQRAAAAGELTAEGLLRAEDHLVPLLLASNPQLVGLLARRRLAPLAGLTERGRERMRESALAYVRHHGNAVAMAAELHVHPQTARYRIARLRELFGDQLTDPDARLELELALRAGA